MKPLIIANWKANPRTPEEAQNLYDTTVRSARAHPDVSVAVCAPFPYIGFLKTDPAVPLFAQNCFWENEGPYTGEVTPDMLKAFVCRGVLLGHSERERYAGETDEMVRKKIDAALAAGLTPVVAIGERERRAKDELGERVSARLQGFSAGDMRKIVLVYEPVWAISTNKGAEPADPEDIFRGVSMLRNAKQGVPMAVLYGGSVDAANIGNVLHEGRADGALVGSASLNSKEFAAIVSKSDKGL